MAFNMPFNKHGFCRKKAFLLVFSKNLGNTSVNHSKLKGSNILSLLMPDTTNHNKRLIAQPIRCYSQNSSSNSRKPLPSILSYFSSAQRERRERRNDGIAMQEPSQRNNVNCVYSLTSSSNKNSNLSWLFYTCQTINLSLALALLSATVSGSLSNVYAHIPWGEYAILDEIGLGLMAIINSGFILGYSYLLWRIPIRIYYDEHNGIYTAAFCRLFIPFRTITFSYPAESLEELPPPTLLRLSGFYSGATLKIRPIQREVYIHHLESLVQDQVVAPTDDDTSSNQYFPPAAASATLAVRGTESLYQQKECYESLKMNKSARKVGYMPPAYASAVAAVAADKSAIGKGFPSWAAAEKKCHAPIQFFGTPIFYHKMLKVEEDPE